MAGRRVLVVEDTTTTGASPLAAVEAVRAAGGEVVAVATIADRRPGRGADHGRDVGALSLPVLAGRSRAGLIPRRPVLGYAERTIDPEGFMLPVLIVVGVIVPARALVRRALQRLISLRNRVQEAWAQIDTELKRRHDLIGNLVETVKGYAMHERGPWRR